MVRGYPVPYDRCVAGDPRDRQEATGRGGRHGLARPRSLGDLGGGRDREAAVVCPALRRRRRAGGHGRRRSRRSATSTSWSVSPDRARPTSGASPTCRRRSSERSCPPRTWNGGWTCCVPPGPTSTTWPRTFPRSFALGNVPPVAPAIRSSATCTSASPTRCRARSRSGHRSTSRPRRWAWSPHRKAYLEAIRAYNAEGKPARSWPIQFLIRRTGHHAMDHAWEMEDRDLTA